MIEDVKCPDCGGPMTPRTNKSDGTKFWGCLRFPVCKGTRDSTGFSAKDGQGREEDDGAGHTGTQPAWKQFRKWDR